MELLGAHLRGVGRLGARADALNLVHFAREVAARVAGELEEHVADRVGGAAVGRASLEGDRVSTELDSVARRQLTPSMALARSDTDASEMWSDASPRSCTRQGDGSASRRCYLGARTHRMDEVGAAESAGDERRARSSGTLNDTGVADVAEDLGVTETTKRQLAPVGVSGKVLDRVQEGAEQTVGLVKVRLGSAVASATTGVNALVNALTHEPSRGIPRSSLVCDVVLREVKDQRRGARGKGRADSPSYRCGDQSRAPWGRQGGGGEGQTCEHLHRAACREAMSALARFRGRRGTHLITGVALGVVDVLGAEVDTQALLRDLEFSCTEEDGSARFQHRQRRAHP